MKISQILFTLGLGVMIGLTSCDSDFESSQFDNISKCDNNLLSIEEVVSEAQEEFNSLFKQTKSAKSVKSIESYKLAKTRADEKGLYGFYILNYENGFAVVSADRRRPGVYAISEESNLSLNDTIDNPGLSVFFRNLENLPSTRIGFNPGDFELPLDSIPFEGGNQELRISSIEEVYPSISASASKISPEYPYNRYLTPINGITPFVNHLAVSTALVMSVCKWPESYSDTSFNWTGMNAGRNSTSWPKLLKLLSSNINLDVEYTNGLGKCNWENIKRTLKNFYYSDSFIINENASELNPGMVRLCLLFDRNNPIMIAMANNNGTDVSWVYDGYKLINYYVVDENGNDTGKYYESIYLHIVWGLGGKGNGYFRFHDLFNKTPVIGGKPTIPDDDNSTVGPYVPIRVIALFEPLKL